MISFILLFFRVVLTSIPSFVFIDTSMSLVGLILFSYFSQCDPLTHPDPNLRISSPNQVLSNPFSISVAFIVIAYLVVVALSATCNRSSVA